MAAGAVAPMILPRRLFGAEAPSNRITIGKKQAAPVQEIVEPSRRVAHAETKNILPNEISGVKTSLLWIPAGGHMDMKSPVDKQHICFVVEGTGQMKTASSEHDLIAKDLFAAQPATPTDFSATTSSTLLLIAMDLYPQEAANPKTEIYPMVRRYAQCEKYRDYFKTPKTTSRTLVHPFTLPRFSMGSVETTGPDRIEPHAHPMLDQHFFSFGDNRCTLLVDGTRHSFGGNCLLHVPLGSEHGIDAAPGDVVNYLWIDFFAKSEDMEYLVKVHKPVNK